MLYTIYRIAGELDGPRIDQLQTDDKFTAERQYFKLVRARTDGPGVVVLSSEAPDVVAAGVYRTDREWPAGAVREQDIIRLGQVWAAPREPWFAGPTRAQVRGLLANLDGTYAELAHEIGLKNEKTPRRWAADSDREPRIPWTAWRTLLVLLVRGDVGLNHL